MLEGTPGTLDTIYKNICTKVSRMLASLCCHPHAAPRQYCAGSRFKAALPDTSTEAHHC